MKIVSGNAPFLRRPRKTGHIMRELLIGLAVVFVAAVIYNFTLGVNYGLKTIGIMVVSILFTLVSDLIAGSLRYSKEKEGKFEDYIIVFIKTNFSVVTAVIFALTIPVGTPVYVVAIGSIFSTLVVKHAFGGFGSNIFNPAALGRLFLALAFGGQLKAYLPGGEALGGLEAGVTVTSQFTNFGTGVGGKFILGGIANTNISMLDLWLGNYNGGLGETFTIVILLVGVVLAAREVINWRTPVFLFGTVAISSVFIALVAQVNILDYLLLQFGLGGLVFGAIFMFTDPVSSPTSNYGKALIGILGGLFNVLIRIAGSYPEGTAFSIALVNVFSPMIDRLIEGRTDTKLWKPYTVSAVMVALSVGLLTGVSAAILPARSGNDLYFASYEGSYSSPKPHASQQAFTTHVTVGLDDRFHIVNLDYDVIESPDRLTDAQHETLVNFYTSISVAEFKALAAPALSDGNTGTTVPAQSGDYILPGAIYSSCALYEGIKDALKDISVHYGEDVSLPREGASENMTLKVNVYVDDTTEKIKTLDVLEGANTTNYKETWEAAYPAILEKYQDLDVATFLTYTSDLDLYGEGGEALVAGVSYSPRRLFAAVQDALEGYGA